MGRGDGREHLTRAERELERGDPISGRPPIGRITHPHGPNTTEISFSTAYEDWVLSEAVKRVGRLRPNSRPD